MQEAWGALSDDDMDRFEGRKDQLVGYIQEKTGESRDAIKKKVDEVARDLSYRL